MTNTTTTTTIKEQTFGVEIEMTGITRKTAAKVVAEYFGTTRAEMGYFHGKEVWGAYDNEGRAWKFLHDGSIYCINTHGDHTENDNFSCEFVTPILRYDDLKDLKEIMSRLVAKGAIANSSTGIHVHVGSDQHTAETLKTLVKFTTSREWMLREALAITWGREHWCRKLSENFIEAIDKASDLEELEQIWYSEANDGYSGGVLHDHYNPTRYHGINLHSFFCGKGVEFRYFNGTTDADKIEAYILLCIAINAYAINHPGKKNFTLQKNYNAKEKFFHMYICLQRNLGLGARDYKVAHKVLNVWAQ